MNKNLTFGLLLAGGALWLWMRQTGQGGILDDLGRIVGGGGGAGNSPGPQPVAVPLDRQLEAAALEGGNPSRLNAHERNSFLAAISGRTPVGDAAFAGAFSDGRDLVKMSANEFLQKAIAAGGTGLSGFRRVGAPLVIDLGKVRRMM